MLYIGMAVSSISPLAMRCTMINRATTVANGTLPQRNINAEHMFAHVVVVVVFVGGGGAIVAAGCHSRHGAAKRTRLETGIAAGGNAVHREMCTWSVWSAK